MEAINKFNIMKYLAIILQVFIGVTAVLGGFGLVTDPSGAKAGLSLEWLAASPFTDYLIPGFFLVVVIGVGNLVIAALTFMRVSHASLLNIIGGLILMMYIGFEVLFVGLQNIMQPLYFGLGITVTLLGVMMYKTTHHRLHPTFSV